MDYEQILNKKVKRDVATGINSRFDINPYLYQFQADLVRWAVKRGRAAIFAFTGAGKNAMGPEWARIIAQHHKGKSIIFEPLGVIGGAIEEAYEILGLKIKHIHSQEEVDDVHDVFITNYERMEKFDPSAFVAVVLDEASILKGFDGKTRNYFIDNWASVPFRLVCSATPAPNDYMELGNYSEFLGILDYYEMLATFFTHDSANTSKWILKGHGAKRFWEWMAGWSVTMTSPADLGYDDSHYMLPPLNVLEVPVATDSSVPFAKTLQERIRVRQTTTEIRCQEAAKIVLNDPDKIWLIWTNLNNESMRMKQLIPWAVEIKGSDKPEYKERNLINFAHGKIKCLVTKPLIAGHGLNFQVCKNTIFVGLSDSAESVYQATRRIWRFGQKEPVYSYHVFSDKEGAVVDNLKRKEKQMEEMQRELVKFTKDINSTNIQSAARENEYYDPNEDIIIPDWMQVSTA